MVQKMEERNIYHDISQRTNGDIYIGVVGPVRTGKSTFIKKFMDTVVIPHMESDYQRDRAVDELPVRFRPDDYDHRAQIHPGKSCYRPGRRLGGL